MVLKAFICFIFINYIVFGKYLLANVKEREIDESNSNEKGVDYMIWPRIEVQKKECSSSFCEEYQSKHVVCYSVPLGGSYMKLGSFMVEMLLKDEKRFVTNVHRDVTWSWSW